MGKSCWFKDDLNHHKHAISLILLNLILLAVPSLAFAHKVNIFAYVEGDMVYTESYFPDGKKVEGGVIEVYDSQGNKLLEGKTNKDGEFKFKPPKRDDLNIILNASMGHKNSYTLPADELPEIPAAQERKEADTEQLKLKEAVGVSAEQLRKIIDDSLDERLKPITRQLARAQQKSVSFTEVIGGIGYIFGIMGLILYFLSRKT
jgi:nickel transport protein